MSCGSSNRRSSEAAEVASTRFILALHCHQPAGNFPWVFEEAYDLAYRPFIELLKDHPAIPVSLHYSGPLLEYFEERHPEFLKSLGGLVARGQVEILGGGLNEPILTMLPPEDALEQIRRMSALLRRLSLVGKEGPRGAWLTERVWEPHLPTLLARADIRYTVVDDHHLELAGLPGEERFGHYMTEDQGNEVALFPSLMQLRYLVPFKPVDEVMETLRRLQSDAPRAVVLADDGEKFGLWPGTFRWVYDEGWLKNFFERIERSRDWLAPQTFSRHLASAPALGTVYLPCASYKEMMEWSKGNFRNFLLKYPEAQAMHRKMLQLSRRIRATRSRQRAKLALAKKYLYLAQGNDPYWHGVFGGLYLRHLRRSVYENLLRCEAVLDRAEKRGHWARAEEDHGQVILRSSEVTLLLEPAHGGRLIEVSDKKGAFNALDTLTRRPESYHKKLSAAPVAAATEQGPASIHERPAQLLAGDLPVYDSYRRAGLIDHFLPLDCSSQHFSAGAAQELGDFLEAPYESRLRKGNDGAQAILTRQGTLRQGGREFPVRLTKTVALPVRGRRIKVAFQIVNLSQETLAFLFGSEMNLGMKDAHVNHIGEAQGISRFSIVDPALRLGISWKFNLPARLWYFPLETFSDSERGIERTYQGVNITFLWRVQLAAGQPWHAAQEFTIESLHGSVH